VLANSKADRTLASITPRIQGLDREVEKVSELLGREQPFIVVHRLIVAG
jgi:hypothetical protein